MPRLSHRNNSDPPDISKLMAKNGLDNGVHFRQPKQRSLRGNWEIYGSAIRVTYNAKREQEQICTKA